MGTFFHIDLDAFFASVELLDDPSLKGKPVIVGAAPGSRRGVVSTCSYEARAFGVHSAMPISEAVRLCPEGVFLPVRMERYAELSSRVMEVFARYTPDLIRVSIDEASLDMTGTERLWGAPPDSALSIKEAVRSETGLSISVGVAANRYVAKIASGVRKPDGLVIVPPGGEDAFMETLPLDKLWGAGEKTRARLAELGVKDMAGLRSLSRGILGAIFGSAGSEFLYGACRGVDPGVYAGEPKSRSMSAETTFERDVADRETLESVLLGMAEELAARMYAAGTGSRCAVLKLRYEDFETVSIRETRPGPFVGSSGIYEAALALLGRKWNGRPIRLIGLGLASLGESDAGQGSLFEDEGARGARLERAAFDAQKRGLGRITRARLVKPPPPRERGEGPDKRGGRERGGGPGKG